ncbi:SGNH/GDSL hydrolase family protein [Paenibacillus mendelii]|uniref:SGNH/GDSL hydrolase family protein n=1 Tax=Paenibacillus mendelii TaxID=206163 RepID=A0ABV6JL81_9BACL|nr:SGNH/GDSL hydrolase family protein [Paenibacillus mendelii]MCQ6562324.1 SGNH/GDSL hydrolase family protein [Paenibacillus mendelii]
MRRTGMMMLLVMSILSMVALPSMPLHAEEEEEDAFLEEAMSPFWLGTTMYNESLLMISSDGELPEASLLFTPDTILSVKSARLDTEYVEGVDWELSGGKIKLLAGSSIPYLTSEEMYPASPPPNEQIPKVGGGYVLFHEGTYFHDRQIVVTYTHAADAWQGPVPAYAGESLPHTTSKLANGQPLKVVLYGDSISVGYNSSGLYNAPPYLPTWGELLVRQLEQTYSSAITAINPSVAGQTSAWGAAEAQTRVAAEEPDLVIIAFGMNDGTAGVTAAQFKANVKSMIETIRQSNPNAEFLLVSTTLANPETNYANQQESYLAVLEQLSGTGIVAVDMTGVHQELLAHKSFADMTGNNVNHPNDFLARWYAQIVSATLINYTPSTGSGQTYYVSSSAGSDSNSGTSSTDAWKTLTKVSSMTFQPGDTILLKKGDTWTNETLYLKGNGSIANWITLSAYGTGDRPVISPYASPASITPPDPVNVANNGLLYAIKLDSNAGWKIQGIEIANSRSGIVYVNDASGVHDGLWVEDCYIHDITKWPLNPFPAAENRAPELQIMPYSVGIYTFYNSGQFLENVTVKNSTFERTDSPLEIRHANRVEVDSVTSTESYRAGIIFTGINYNYTGTPIGLLTSSVVLHAGLHGMTWGTAGLQFNAVHNFTADNVEVGYTVSPNSPDGVGVDYEGLNKNVTLQNSYIHDNEDEAVMVYRNPQWSGGIENENTSLIDNLFENNGIKNDGVHAAFLVQQYNLNNGGTISGNTIVKAYRQQPLNMIIERNPQQNEFWPSSQYQTSNNVVKLRNGNIIHYASTGYSATQGANGWSYEQYDGSSYANMSWVPSAGVWQGASSNLYIGEDWMHPAIGSDAVRTWTVASNGKLRITGKVNKSDSVLGDGVEASIWHNGTRIWGSATVTDLTGSEHDLQINAAAGDQIRFVVNDKGDPSYDKTTWNPVIEEIVQTDYSASADFSRTQNMYQWRYEQWDGSVYSAITWDPAIGVWANSLINLYIGSNWQHPGNGVESVRKWVAPSAGTVRVTGTAGKFDSTAGNGVIVSILKNNAVLWGPHTVTTLMGIDHDMTVAVNAGDELSFMVGAGGDPSYDKTGWDPMVDYQ